MFYIYISLSKESQLLCAQQFSSVFAQGRILCICASLIRCLSATRCNILCPLLSLARSDSFRCFFMQMSERIHAFEIFQSCGIIPMKKRSKGERKLDVRAADWDSRIMKSLVSSKNALTLCGINIMPQNNCCCVSSFFYFLKSLKI